MREEVQAFLSTRQDLVIFLRNQPVWYRRLSREPYALKEFEEASKVFYGQTFPQKVDRFQNQLNMVNMMLALMTQLKN
ncbi:YlbE-like family protein [Pseudalkalibacillus hwajinpoensis]|uniref:YlbE-like family protein n=1 Tax=Guptibacillus hwajinpoensis TaxID=208199 RepID=UPI00325A9414